MKTIFVEPAGKLHSAYKQMMDDPPEGYRFISDQGAVEKGALGILYNQSVYHLIAERLAKAVPLHYIRSYAGKFRKPPKGTDLTYACGHLNFRDEPWVVELEWAPQLTGFSMRYFNRFRKTIEKKLRSDNCKKVICMSELTRQTVINNLDADGIAHKVEPLYRTVRPKDFTKEFNDEKVSILFLSSINIPEQFEDEKGGKELLDAWDIISPQYDNVELVVRSDVIPRVGERISKMKNVRLIDRILPWVELEREFKTADIVLLPAHHTPSLAFLDAMSYELPVVTIDSWANGEIVEDGKTGIVSAYPQDELLPVSDFVPSGIVLPVKRGTRATNPEVVRELAANTCRLIEDSELRRKLGKQARYEVEHGKFSLKRRRERLGQILDEATA